MIRKFFAAGCALVLLALPATVRAASMAVNFDRDALTVNAQAGRATAARTQTPSTHALASDLSTFVIGDGMFPISAAISPTTSANLSLTSIDALASQGTAGATLIRGGERNFAGTGVALILLPHRYSISAAGLSGRAYARIHAGATGIFNAAQSTDVASTAIYSTAIGNTAIGNAAIDSMAIDSTAIDRFLEVAAGQSQSGYDMIQLALDRQNGVIPPLQRQGEATAYAFGDSTSAMPPVPEPAPVMLLLSGLLLLVVQQRRWRRGQPIFVNDPLR